MAVSTFQPFRNQRDEDVLRWILYIYLGAGLVVAFPSLDKLLLDRFGLSMLVFCGNALSIGPGKTHIFESVFGVASVLALSCYFLLSQRYQFKRIFCMVTLFLLLYAQTFYSVYPSENLDQLKIVNLPTVDYAQIFEKKKLLATKITTEKELGAAAQSLFSANQAMLAKRWGISDPDRLNAYFLLNLASSLWAFGNQAEFARSGCVSTNEGTHFAVPAHPSVRDYLTSQIGCCSDYAYILKVMLDGAGIRNRRVVVTGHVFNEAWIDHKWNVLDATVGMAFHDSWQDIQSRQGRERDSVVVTIFPRQDLVFGTDNPDYRSSIGHFRQALLLKAIGKELPVIAYPDGM